MIKKILWASDGSKDSTEVLEFVELLAKRFKADVLGVYVIPDYYEVEVVEDFPSHESESFDRWVREIESKQSDRLENIESDLKQKGINFKVKIGQGTPHKEILRIADNEKCELIVLGRGRADEKFILGTTTLKVLRQSSIPVLTARENGSYGEVKKILVPSDIHHPISAALEYSVEFSQAFGSTIYHLNVVEVEEHKIPPELVANLRGTSFTQMEESVVKAKIGENIETAVEVARNAWLGIVNFIEKERIDLIVMMTYGGKKPRRGDFIGSIAERVVQVASCPVITIKP